jgi:hypothetical protein
LSSKQPLDVAIACDDKDGIGTVADPTMICDSSSADVNLIAYQAAEMAIQRCDRF